MQQYLALSIVLQVATLEWDRDENYAHIIILLELFLQAIVMLCELCIVVTQKFKTCKAN